MNSKEDNQRVYVVVNSFEPKSLKKKKTTRELDFAKLASLLAVAVSLLATNASGDPWCGQGHRYHCD